MSREKFTLLDRKYPENDASLTGDARVQAMRAEARELRDKNNSLVRQIWDLETELRTPGLSNEQKDLLSKTKKTISNEILNEKYIDRVNALLNEIEHLEIALYGRSDVRSDSPSIL